MNIVIASGKGGTGKTTIAVNLASVIPAAQYIDCDVEAPNGHLFLHPHIDASCNVTLPVPRLIDNLCVHCGVCASVCEFNAIASLPETVLVYDELCHGCGACIHLCPQKALTEIDRCIGIIETGSVNGLFFAHGKLNIGEPLGPPLVKKLKQFIEPQRVTIIDAPPGTSCPMVTTVIDADAVLLVTEPTPFGLNDLELAVEVVCDLNIPAGVIINKAVSGNRSIHEYCEKKSLPILLEFPFDLAVARSYSRGELLVGHTHYRELFQNVYKRIQKEYHETTGHTQR